MAEQPWQCRTCVCWVGPLTEGGHRVCQWWSDATVDQDGRVDTTSPRLCRVLTLPTFGCAEHTPRREG